jgi:hypothetical protein
MDGEEKGVGMVGGGLHKRKKREEGFEGWESSS